MRGAFRQKSDKLFGFQGRTGDIFFHNLNAAGSRSQISGYHVHQRGFTCAVGAEQGDDFSAAGLETEVADGYNFAEIFCQIGYFNGYRHRILL